MRTLVSKIAGLILVSVILSASCLSCLLRATPIYAATSTTVVAETDQSKDCEGKQNVIQEDTVVIKTPLSITPTIVTAPSSDRNAHGVKHGIECNPTYNQTSFSIKQLQTAEHHFATTGHLFVFHTNHVYRQWSLAPPRILPKNTILLTGTTIKKE